MIETLDNNVPLVNAVENLQGMIQGDNAQVRGFHPEIFDGPNGVYMCDVLPDRALEIQFQDIQAIEQLSLGASDTHHEVRFGQATYIDVDGQETEAVVAIKHFDDALENAVSECESLLAVQQRGLDTIAPVAIVKESDTSAYLITLFRPDVISLDNYDWSVRPGERGFNKLTENLRFMAESMATMHALGVFHGDFQPKNCLRSDTGQLVVEDLEKGCTVARTPEEHVAAFNDTDDAPMGTSYHDQKLLWRTLNRPIGLRENNIFLGHEATPEEMYTTFLEHFIIPYTYRLEEITDPAIYSQLNVTELAVKLDAKIRSELGLSEHVTFASDA